MPRSDHAGPRAPTRTSALLSSSGAAMTILLVASPLRARDEPGAEAPAAGIRAVVEADEVVYRYTPADNGAGPMWCHGSTCIVRAGERVLVSGLETIEGARPLNNCRALLFRRAAGGEWEQVWRSRERTREPGPLATLPGGRVFLSVNPTLTPPDARAGPAEPRILEFRAEAATQPPRTERPVWAGKPPFSEHSYRSFAADARRGELLLLQNIGYGHAEWALRGPDGRWTAQGRLAWPWGAEYETPQPIRLCYPAVALSGGTLHFCGVSDIVEPRREWREHKKRLTGREWDYDFRRLFYTRSRDLASGTFHDWVEVSSREATCGWIFPMDLHVGAGGDVHLLWTERALDERLRERFFPDAKQRHSLEYARLREGKVVERVALVEGGEERGGERPGDGRFHVLEDGRLLVICYVGGHDPDGAAISENRLLVRGPDGRWSRPVRIDIDRPLRAFFNATERSGCRPGRRIDLLGEESRAMRYVGIRLEEGTP